MTDPAFALDSPPYHVPVLLKEALTLLALKPGNTALDATVGGGGHSEAIARQISPGGTLVGLDFDVEAIVAARLRLTVHADVRTILVQTGFGELEAALSVQENTSGTRFDGVLFDLGVSSHQLDTARGFTFRRDEPLDMRMNAADSSRSTAAELLAAADEPEIARILWEYGDEHWSRRIAQRIVDRRKKGSRIETTAQFAALIEQSIPRRAWPRDIHVATRSFQALRIVVNDELGQLRAGLAEAVERLAPNGRLVVISYHSLEDRIVKQMFAALAGRAPYVPGSSPAALLPAPRLAAKAVLLTRKPVVPTDVETASNPRARSAKLRALQRIC